MLMVPSFGQPTCQSQKKKQKSKGDALSLTQKTNKEELMPTVQSIISLVELNAGEAKKERERESQCCQPLVPLVC